MAQVFPKYELIISSKVPPTEGELCMLDFLIKHLDDNYEIFFQPFLNGDRPDIIIMRKDAGVLIIEVKDWNLEHYNISTNSVWEVSDGTNIGYVKSPFKQVFQYKENIFNLHVDSLVELKIKNPSLFSTIVCGVYFHNSNKSELNKKIIANFNQNESYQNFISHFILFGKDELTTDILNLELHKRWLDRPSKIFPECIYKSLKRFLQPPFHPSRDIEETIYSDEQKLLIESKVTSQKIKGIAGSGKTLVLAKRAVNAHLRTRKTILILTFNITLRNYIHDKISNVKEDFSWEAFHIIHYHQFFLQEANNVGLNIGDISDFDNEKFFKSVKKKLSKYDVILIDEGQDFKYSWFNIIKNYFLVVGGEYVIFADEKQNIYNRSIDKEKKTETNIIGRWNETLKKSYRLSFDIAQLGLEFQKTYLSHKYNIDTNIEISQQADVFVKESVCYNYLEVYTPNKIIEIIHNLIIENSIHPNDVGILSSQASVGRELDYLIRTKWNENTKTMFESSEIYKTLYDDFYLKNNIRFNEEIKEIRRNKKFNFWMNPGTTKLSTIHSFKGWEINTLFLIISESEEKDKASTEELIYTGITRCRNNLFIINLGVKKYHHFFELNI